MANSRKKNNSLIDNEQSADTVKSTESVSVAIDADSPKIQKKRARRSGSVPNALDGDNGDVKSNTLPDGDITDSLSSMIDTPKEEAKKDTDGQKTATSKRTRGRKKKVSTAEDNSLINEAKDSESGKSATNNEDSDIIADEAVGGSTLPDEKNSTYDSESPDSTNESASASIAATDAERKADYDGDTSSDESDIEESTSEAPYDESVSEESVSDTPSDESDIEESASEAPYDESVSEENTSETSFDESDIEESASEAPYDESVLEESVSETSFDASAVDENPSELAEDDGVSVDIHESREEEMRFEEYVENFRRTMADMLSNAKSISDSTDLSEQGDELMPDYDKIADDEDDIYNYVELEDDGFDEPDEEDEPTDIVSEVETEDIFSVVDSLNIDYSSVSADEEVTYTAPVAMDEAKEETEEPDEEVILREAIEDETESEEQPRINEDTDDGIGENVGESDAVIEDAASENADIKDIEESFDDAVSHGGKDEEESVEDIDTDDYPSTETESDGQISYKVLDIFATESASDADRITDESDGADTVSDESDLSDGEQEDIPKEQAEQSTLEEKDPRQIEIKLTEAPIDKPTKKISIESRRRRRKYDPEHPKIVDFVYEAVEAIVFMLLIAITVSTFFVRFSHVSGGSMENTLSNGDYVLISNLFYTPERGDIIVFEDKDIDDSSPLVKRVIGISGDTVRIERTDNAQYTVYLNGEVLTEEYVYVNGMHYRDPSGEWTVGEGEIFVLGDHRNVSRDSREFGPVRVEGILGKVLLRLYPFDSFGTVD